MAEVDYQLALLLQHKFEQEAKDSQIAKTLQQRFESEYEAQKRIREGDTNLNDSLIAKSLQDQFQKESEIERPSQNLVYVGSSSGDPRQNTKSLTDPSWEVIDPTPDIHNLFMAFNERFFWNQLGSVCVGWSKKMTSCAGICSYQGRGGMCTIALSEPLLKLRPRKDLVETLLHEMIHAYLFVTHNNRDRDGHGPEFHKHMYRINSEAGTNITVYHDFHDEVRLYQQHWWKCTGPCQNWKPYFGMVRRAMNRAPGPNDRWWAEHAQKCGGQFVKVKEPEKVTQSKSEPPKNQPDIRKFFSPIKTLANSSSSTGNIHTISNINTNSTIQTTVENSTNIFGFTNLTGKNNALNKKGGTMVRNNSNTVVINKKNITIDTKDKSNINPTKVDKNRTRSTPETILVSDSRDYSIVRNHWVNKFSDTNKNNSKPEFSKPCSSLGDTLSLNTFNFKDLKRSSDSTYDSQKIPKLSESLVECPNCSKKITESQVNSHLDECLITLETTSHNSNDVKNDMEKSEEDDVFIVDHTSNSGEKECEVCHKMVPSAKYGIHVNECLHGMIDEIEEKLNDNQEAKNESLSETECLACKKKILKSELNDHLEECLNLSHIFDDTNEPIEENEDESQTSATSEETVNSYNCPVCMKLVSETTMNDHIDICLSISN